MARQNINLGTSPNDGEGDNLRTAFDKTNDNFIEIYTAGPVGTNVTISGNVVSTTNTNGNLVLSPDGTGLVVFRNSTVPNSNNTSTIGSTSLRFKGIYAGTTGIDSAGPIVAGEPISLPNYANATVRDSSITSPTAGMIILNGTTFQGYNGSAWVDLN